MESDRTIDTSSHIFDSTTLIFTVQGQFDILVAFMVSTMQVRLWIQSKGPDMIWRTFALLKIQCIAQFVAIVVAMGAIPCDPWSPAEISPCFHSRRPPCQTYVSLQAAAVPCLGENSKIPGRVEDPDCWVHLSSESLKRCTGASLFERLGVSTPKEVHDNTRYAVLSHGVQDDPIYHYFNRAAFGTFQFPEKVAYKTPSRYSAPPGPERDVTRARQVDDAVQRDHTVIREAIRQTYHGDLLRVRNILLWNVYDENGDRVGQTAIYDRHQVEPYEP
jgi:MEKHLA domain